MGDELGRLLAALEAEVGSTALAADSKHTAVWCVRHLPVLYDRFRRTNESRYGEEISRLVRAALQALAGSKGNCPASLELAAALPGRLRRLHERFGVPPLKLDPPGPPRSRSRKAC